MKGLLFFGALALLAFVSCKEDNVEPEPEPVTGYDEAWYAANATISSSDASFAITDEGGAISFKAEGGSVVVYVDCGTEWTADDSEAGVFGCDVQETCITVTAEQNLVEEELYGTIILMTLPSQIHFATISITQNAYGAPEITVEANEWHIPAVAATAEELTTVIGVEATGEWEIESDAEWLTAEKGENSVSLTAAENETTEERVAEVVLTCTDGYNSDSETITVTQDARAYITLSAEEFEFEKMGGEAEVTVESNYEWSYEYESDWFTVTENTDGSLTITVDVNTNEDAREGVVTFTAGDAAANVAEATLTITQEAFDPASLVLEYTITSDNTAIELPLWNKADGNTYTLDCTVDWGDGSEVESFDTYPSHTYSSAGTYYVSISGIVESIDNSQNPSPGLTAVIQWGDIGLKNMKYSFFNCRELVSLPEGPGPFENVTSFEEAFNSCTSLIRVPEDLFKNCTKCTNIYGLFNGCASLAAAPSFEGLSNVTEFRLTFAGCTSLTTVPVNIFSGCTAVTNFSLAFEGCSAVEGESPYDEINVNGDTVRVHLYERENYPEYFTTPTLYGSCFSGCTKLDDYDDIPDSWK